MRDETKEITNNKTPLYVTLSTAAKMMGVSNLYLGYLMRNKLIDVGVVIKEQGKKKRKYLVNVEKLKAL